MNEEVIRKLEHRVATLEWLLLHAYANVGSVHYPLTVYGFPEDQLYKIYADQCGAERPKEITG